jgi:hypothetical protein
MCVAVRASASERESSAHLENTTKDEERVDAAIERHSQSVNVCLQLRKGSKKYEMKRSRLTDQSSMAYFHKFPA